MGIVFSTVLIFYGIIFLIGRFTVDAVKQAPKRVISRRDADRIIKYVENQNRWYREFNISSKDANEFSYKYNYNKEFQELVLNRVCEILDSIGATYNNLPAREALKTWDALPHQHCYGTHFIKGSMDLIRDVWYLDHGRITSDAQFHGFGGWFSAPKFEAKCDSSKFYDWALKRLADYGFDNAKLYDRGVGGPKRIDPLGDCPKTSLTRTGNYTEVQEAYVAIKNGDVKIY